MRVGTELLCIAVAVRHTTKTADRRTSGDLQHPGSSLQLLNGSSCRLRNPVTAPSSSEQNCKCCSHSTIPRSSEETRA